jgi:hypothetical protein
MRHLIPIQDQLASHQLLYKRGGLLRPTPTLQEPRQAGHAPSRGCTVHAQGLRVGVIDSLGGSFVGTLEPWVATAAAAPKREALCCKSADCLPEPFIFITPDRQGQDPQ